MSLIFVVSSTLLVLVYLQKGFAPFIGKSSFVVRGFIQASYFFYSASFFGATMAKDSLVLGIALFFLYAARSLVGDIRDVKHNYAEKKQTFPVVYGVRTARFVSLFLLLAAVATLRIHFNSYSIVVPIVLYIASLLFYTSWYVLHQLAIVTTLFFSALMIAWFTGQNTFFINLIYAGIYSNFLFYPLLKRKSNPRYGEE